MTARKVYMALTEKEAAALLKWASEGQEDALNHFMSGDGTVYAAGERAIVKLNAAIWKRENK